MKILVCIKHVPDTETKIKVAADGVSIDETGVKMILSPYDEYALEEALRIREAHGGEVVLVSAGREAAQTSLRQGLAMGADRAVLVRDDRYDRADALTRAKALAAVARAEEPTLVFCGRYGVGTDEGQTGPMLAELLDLPHAAAVDRLELAERTFTAHRGIEGAVEILEGTLPALVTWDKTEHEPRYASLKGIMAAKKKPLEVKTPESLGVQREEAAERARLVWESLELPAARKAGRVLQGEPDEVVRELVRLLREEAKVI